MRQERLYLPQLDTLRLFAMLAIICYHFFTNSLPGGFLAVDIFLILSGYLVTSQLERRLREGKSFRLGWQFFRRLGKMFWPLVFFIILLLALLLLFQAELLTNIRPVVFSSLAFVNNWYQIAIGSSYFAEFLHPSLLTHLWYLGVYLQSLVVFYFIYGLLRRRMSKQHFTYFLIVLALISVAWMAFLFTPGQDPSRAYYGTDSRLFSFLLGSIAFLMGEEIIGFSYRLLKTSWTPDLIALVTAGILAVLMKFLTDSSIWTYYGGMLVFDLLVVLFVLAIVQDQSFIGKILRFKPLAFIGRKNYFVYLTYYPIYIVFTAHASQQNWFTMQPWLQVLAIFVIGLLLDALVNQRLVTIPIYLRPKGEPLRLITGFRQVRSKETPWYQKVLFWGFTLVLALALFALVTAPKGEVVLKSEAEAREAREAIEQANREKHTIASDSDEDIEKYRQSLSQDQQAIVSDFSNEVLYQANGLSFTFLGDSLTIDVSKGITALFPRSNICAKVGLQVYQAGELIDSFSAENEIQDKVVVDLGANGGFTSQQINQLLKRFEGKKIYLVNTHVNRPWRQQVNEALKATADSRKDCQLIDWSTYYDQNAQADWLSQDGIHFSKAGVKAWTDYVGRALIEDNKW